MRIALAKDFKPQLYKRHDALVNDMSLPSSVRHMVIDHMSKPWIPGFLSVAIRPTGEGSKIYLGFEIGKTDGSEWYFPSKKWWVAHAKASHPPNGNGCSVATHVDFLTKEGATHEFDYATAYADGSLKILHPDDFEKECRWWRSRKAR